MAVARQSPGSRVLALANIVTAIALASAPAAAAPGDHIRVGDTTITPSVMSGLEFHSNVYLADGGTGAPEVPALAWVLKPRLKLDLDAKQAKVGFELGYSVKKFFDVNPDDAFNVQNLDRYSDFDAQLAANFLPKSAVGARLDDKFEVSSTPAELATKDGLANASVVRTSNDLTGGAVIRPGTALTVDALGLLGVDNYEVPEELIADETDSAFNNRIQYGPLVNGSWRFLPKTSLVSSFSYTFMRWDKNFIEAIGPDLESSAIGAYVGKPDADAWRFSAGINGQFTPKLAAAGSAGFGAAYYDEQSVLDDAAGFEGSSAELNTTGDETFATDSSVIDGFLFNVQVSYAPIRGQTITGGYRKDFQDAVFTNYVAYHYLFLKYEGSMQNRLGLGAEVNYRIDQYHGELARGDQNLSLKGSASYKLTSYLTAAGGVAWARRACLDKNCDDDQFYSTQYDDVSATANLTFTY